MKWFTFKWFTIYKIYVKCEYEYGKLFYWIIIVLRVPSIRKEFISIKRKVIFIFLRFLFSPTVYSKKSCWKLHKTTFRGNNKMANEDILESEHYPQRTAINFIAIIYYGIMRANKSILKSAQLFYRCIIICCGSITTQCSRML